MARSERTRVTAAAMETLERGLTHRGIRRVSVARNVDLSCDLAAALPSGDLFVARVVSVIHQGDRTALRTMLTQGDFDRAILVYCDKKDGDNLSDDIETWWIGDIDKLAVSLAGAR